MNKKITQKNDFKKSHSFNKTKSKQNIIQSAQYSQNGGANPGPDWFKNIFGFNEIRTLNGYEQLNYIALLTIKTEEETIDATNPLFSLFTTNTKTKAEKHTLNCKASGVNPIFKKQYIGMFDRPSVGDLETCIANEKNTKDFANLKKDKKLGGLTFQHILTTDVALLHCDPTNAGAVFQVASQFNCLEMIDPDKTPNNGVTIYYNDRTQGPACAMACPAALVYRNYFVKNGTQEGQLKVQINNLEDIGKLLENNNDALWNMQNGYVIIDDVNKLEQIKTKIKTATSANVINALRVGVHWATSVVDNNNQKLMDHQVCQVYASALPVSTKYNPIITIIDKWTDFATCILDGSYRATLCIAALIALKSKTRIKCYLTCIGGGAFGNKPEWIINAIKKALVAYADYPIDVMLVHFNKHAGNYKDRAAIETQIPQDYTQLQHIPANGADPAPKTAKGIHSVITPNVVTPNVVTPNVITPKVDTPKVVNPKVVNPKVVRPAAGIAAIADNDAKKKHKNKKDTIGKDRAINAETHELEVKDANVKAETDEALIDKAANVDTEGNGLRQAGSKDLAQVDSAANGNVSATNGNDNATIGNVNATNGNDNATIGNVNATNGNDNATNGNDNATIGNVSAAKETPSPSFDISPEGSNGQGMLIGFLILCTLGIGAVSFIK